MNQEKIFSVPGDGYLFTIQQGHPREVLLRVVAAFGLFCAVSGTGGKKYQKSLGSKEGNIYIEDAINSTPL